MPDENTTVYVSICACCGYQWDETAKHTFVLDCPVCRANMIYKYEPTKQEVMGDEYDGIPWY